MNDDNDNIDENSNEEGHKLRGNNLENIPEGWLEKWPKLFFDGEPLECDDDLVAARKVVLGKTSFHIQKLLMQVKKRIKKLSVGLSFPDPNDPSEAGLNPLTLISFPRVPADLVQAFQALGIAIIPYAEYSRLKAISTDSAKLLETLEHSARLNKAAGIENAIRTCMPWVISKKEHDVEVYRKAATLAVALALTGRPEANGNSSETGVEKGISAASVCDSGVQG